MAKFYRVTGASTQKKGVTPDIELPSLIDPEEYGEASHKHVMPWDMIDDLRVAKVAQPVAPLLDKLRENYRHRINNNKRLQKVVQFIPWWKEHRKRQTLSLNLQQRIALGKENKERYERIEKMLEQKIPGVGDDKTTKEQDLYLTESLEILADLVKMFGR